MNRLFAVAALLWSLTAGAQPARLHKRMVAVAETRAGDHADSLADIAAIFARKGEWDRAVAMLDEARARRPQDPDVLGDLIAACLHAESCAARRLPLLRQGLEKLPQPAELLDELVRELVRLKQSARVVPELRAFVARHPKDDEARALVIDTALESGQRAIALEELATYVARRPDDVQRRSLYVELLRDTHQEAASSKQLHALLKAYPDSVGGLCLRAERLVDRGDLNAAERELGHARQMAQRHRQLSERICRAEDDVECLAELADDDKLVGELQSDLRRARAEQYRDFRSDVGMLDLAEDLQREQDRDP